MSLLFNKREYPSAADLIQGQGRVAARVGSVRVNADSAMAHSAVWACLRLRADLVSTLPIDVYREMGGVEVQVPKPPVITQPGGPDCLSTEWRYSSQVDLDRYGNCFGLITQRGGDGFPSRIDLVSAAEVTVHIQDGVRFYRINGDRYEAEQVWHERQWTVAGLPVGLSPVAAAAMSIGQYLSAQQFALDWFSSGSIPSARLKNTAKRIDKTEAALVKDRFKDAISNRDVFVHGSDWDYEMISVPANEAQFIEAMRFGAEDICRFFAVPASAIDAASPGSGGSITYANITQADLHLLVRNLNPTIVRREEAWSANLVAAPRRVRLNSDALLRMDPKTRQEMLRADVAARLRTFTEARALMNLPPLDDADLAEFAAVAPPPTQNGAASNGTPTQQ